jgi:microcystin-dependent protein
LRQLSGKTTDFVDGTNNCQSIHVFLPAGIVVDYAGPTIPPIGWLYCDGRSLLMTDYPDLYAAIGTTYGSVDATHFNIPDTRGKVTAGAGANYGTLGQTAGAATVTLLGGHLPSHAHTMGNHTHNVTDHFHYMNNHTHAGVNHLHSFTGVDHTHPIPGGQFSHTHAATQGVIGGNNPVQGLGAGGFTYYSPQAIVLGAATLPAGGTGASDRSLASNTGAADRDLTTGGPNTPYTGGSDRALGTTGPLNNSTDAYGSNAPFSILPPYLVTYKIIKT